MKCSKCNKDAFDVSTLMMSKFLPFISYVCLMCGWTKDEIIQPERLSERAPEGDSTV